MSEPTGCGRGSVQTKCKSAGLKARIVPSAQPQKIISSDRDRDWAMPVYKAGRNTTRTLFQLKSSIHNIHNNYKKQKVNFCIAKSTPANT